MVLRYSGSGPVVNQTFTASDGTALTSLGWTAEVGTFKVVGNQATPNSGANGDQTVLDAGVSDFTLSCQVTPCGSWGNERDPDLIVRWSDSSDYWLVHVSAGAQELELIQVSSGTQTVRGSVSFAFASGTSYVISVSASGATIAVSVNGVQGIGYASATMNETSTKVGLYLTTAELPNRKLSAGAQYQPPMRARKPAILRGSRFANQGSKCNSHPRGLIMANQLKMAISDNIFAL